MNYLLITSLIIFLSSCSSQSWSELFNDDSPEQRNKELMESFGTEEEVLEKFAETEKVEQKPTESTSKQVEKKVVKKRPVKKQVQSKRQKPKKVESPKKTIDKKVAATWPKDYPQELKEISKNSQKLWKSYTPKFFAGEKIFMDINYMGISTGKIVLTTEQETVIGERPVYHVNARVKTADYYRYLYELDDNIDSYILKDIYSPVKFSLIQRESGQDVDDLQLFDIEKLKTYSFYKRVTEDRTKKKKSEEFIPNRFTDPLHVIWFLRGLPMESGLSFEVPIINRGKIIILKTKNKGLETIETDLGEMKAYKMSATTSYTGETLKSGEMTFWFSADERRTFLQFKAKIKIGSISGEIKKYKK
ncbi:MAG: DUF3108 domain-containing protein [Bacteriovoracaceae bacterium]|nr:DUF3108 domain-containing protein [Bacteriovoracaceae bacterium]